MAYSESFPEKKTEYLALSKREAAHLIAILSAQIAECEVPGNSRGIGAVLTVIDSNKAEKKIVLSVDVSLPSERIF